MFQRLFNQCIYKTCKVIHGLNDIELFLNNQMTIWTCVFLSLDVVNDIINKQNISTNGFESMHVIDEIKSSLL
jgi:hypothetical protein